MSRRGLPALFVVVLGLIGIVIVGRDVSEQPTPFFAATGGTWMPAVGASGALTGSWYCPGVPTDGGEGVGGEIVVSNGEAAQVVGRYQILTEDGVVADEQFTVGSWSQTTIDVGAVSDADFASVIVEVEGGTGFVEQVARHPLGDSVAACSNDTSPTWYLRRLHPRRQRRDVGPHQSIRRVGRRQSPILDSGPSVRARSFSRLHRAAPVSTDHPDRRTRGT